jgi:hypothetical protein
MVAREVWFELISQLPRRYECLESERSHRTPSPAQSRQMTRALIETAAESDRQACSAVVHHRGGDLQGCVGNLFGEDVVIFSVENAGRTIHGVPQHPRATERTTPCSCGQGVAGAYGSFCGDDTHSDPSHVNCCRPRPPGHSTAHKFRPDRACCVLKDAASANQTALTA